MKFKLLRTFVGERINFHNPFQASHLNNLRKTARVQGSLGAGEQDSGEWTQLSEHSHVVPPGLTQIA